MALEAACVVDVAALAAPPIIGPGHIALAARFGLLSAMRLGLGVVAALAAIAEVKVQKRTFPTIPLAMKSLTLAGVSPVSAISGPRPRSLLLSLLLVLLLLRLPVSVEHD
jgi:hypothetical protein